MNYLINYFIDKIGKRFDEISYEVNEQEDEIEELFDRLDGLEELRLTPYLKGLKNCEIFIFHPTLHNW